MNELIHRSYGFSVRAMNEEKRSVDVIASSAAIDAYGEVLVQDWDLKRFKANPVVLYGHNSYGLPIGFASDVKVEDDQLVATLNLVDARANPVAEQVWQGIVQGSLRAVSVGFRSKRVESRKVGERDVYVLSGNELLEISVVPIPANPEAVAIAKKSMDLIRELAGSPQPQQETTMKSIAAALALVATASEGDIAAEAARLKALETELLAGTGKKTVAEALGVVQAWKAAGAKVAELQAELEQTKADAAQRERDELVAKAREAGKLSPAQVEWAKACPIETLKAFLETAPAIPAFKAAPQQPKSVAATLSFKGKSWDELSFDERHELHNENHDLYEAMRDAAA